MSNAAPTLRPGHKPVKACYAKRHEHETHGVLHELATKVAFGSLLDAAAKRRGWNLRVEPLRTKRAGRVAGGIDAASADLSCRGYSM